MTGESGTMEEVFRSLERVTAPDELLKALSKLQEIDSAQSEELQAALSALRKKTERLGRKHALPEELRTQALQVSKLARSVANPEKIDSREPEESSIADDPELIRDFVLESREHLSTVEQNLLEIERNPANTEYLHATFRSFHTIKGLAGFLGFIAVQEVSHETETLLDLARSGLLGINPRVIDVVLRSADYLKGALDRIENRDPGVSCERAPEALLKAVNGVGKIGGAAHRDQAAETSVAQEVAEMPDVVQAAETTPIKDFGSGAALKVDAEKIEYLIDMVGELVIAQSMVRQNPAIVSLADPILNRCLAQLTRVTAEVQKTAMTMRMAPVTSLFQKMSRVARDVARKSGKKVSMAIVGGDAQMDRKILDGLAEPLMHMIRNAVDHGVEKPEERVAAGKSATGTIRLRAERESGNIVIEIADDGRGLNTEKIRQKAIERGLITENARLAVEDIHRLIFEPGFSTAEKLTEFSGRGVGMDVVRRQVETLRGRVEISSAAGKGSIFTVRVPLTLAMVDGLLLRVGSEKYILPTFAVREIFRVDDASVFTITGKNEMVHFRESTIPVVRLSERLKVRDRSAGKKANIMIVVQSGTKQACLAVDEVIGKQEVVIKSLGNVFRNLVGLAGGAILGDGRVGLILDIEGLLNSRYSSAAAKTNQQVGK